MVVELPSGTLPDVLITAAEAVDGVEVDAVRPYAGVLDTHRELELIEQIAENPGEAMGLLAAGVPRIIRAGWALVVSQSTTGIERLAASEAAPEAPLDDVPWLPLDRARILDAERSWVPRTWRDLGTELAATPLGKPQRALLVGRPGGPVYRTSEIARLAHLTGTTAALLANG